MDSIPQVRGQEVISIIHVQKVFQERQHIGRGFAQSALLQLEIEA
jgi:hypothetical protein